MMVTSRDTVIRVPLVTFHNWANDNSILHTDEGKEVKYLDFSQSYTYSMFPFSHPTITLFKQSSCHLLEKSVSSSSRSSFRIQLCIETIHMKNFTAITLKTYEMHNTIFYKKTLVGGFIFLVFTNTTAPV